MYIKQPYKLKSIIPLALIVFFTCIISTPLVSAAVTNTPSSIKVHFLTTGGINDAILLESVDTDGTRHFAMIDAAEDSDYPKSTEDSSRYPARIGTTIDSGFEESVLAYLYKVGVTKDNFEFFIGTHAHSDHLGGADDVIRAFKPRYVYLQEYRDAYVVSDYQRYDNQYVYDQTIAAAREVGAQIIQYFANPTIQNEDNLPKVHSGTAIFSNALSESSHNTLAFVERTPDNTSSCFLKLGEHMNLQILNYGNDTYPVTDINNASLSVKISAFGRNILLTGDTNNRSNSMTNFYDTNSDGFDEDRLLSSGVANDIDIYKLGHHGFPGSNTTNFLKSMNPSYIVQTGSYHNIPLDTLDVINYQLSNAFFTTSALTPEEESIVFQVNANGSITHNQTNRSFILTCGTLRTYYKNGHPTKHKGLLNIPDPKGNVSYFFETSSYSPSTNLWQNIDGNWYYFGADGKMLVDTMHSKDGHTYYLGTNDIMATGWQNIDNRTLYFTNQGHLAKGWTLIDHKYYYFDNDGTALTGTQQIDGTFYFLDDNGILKTGWIQSDGGWFYYDESGNLSVDWKKINSNWYYFDQSGLLKTGWFTVNDSLYYATESGTIAIGWFKDQDTWYYADQTGTLQSGWKQFDETWYYLNHDGAMVTGWLKDDQNWYYLDTSGQMKIGWIKDTDNWYLTNNEGIMQTGWQADKGDWYYFEENGIMKSGWLMENKMWYASAQLLLWLVGQ